MFEEICSSRFVANRNSFVSQRSPDVIRANSCDTPFACYLPLFCQCRPRRKPQTVQLKVLSPNPGLAAIFGASITGRIATGPKAGQRLETFGDFQTEQNPEERFESSGSRYALVSGFSVHAGVAIRAVDRKGLGRLCKYVMRPPLAAGRLAQLPDGRLSYQLKTPWKNGTTHVIFEPLEFMAWVAALVPVPRGNMVYYYGVIAPAAKWRGESGGSDE